MAMGTDGSPHQLRLALQAQLDNYTEELSRLTSPGADPEHGGLDKQTVAALAESTRRGLADTMEALKRLADGTYGHCQHCRGEIPVERLRILPHVRFCVPCQEVRRG